MKQVAGWWLPDHEVHLRGWLAHPKNRDDVADGRVMYQGRKLRKALELCKSFGFAVDVGGHCGTWSHYLAQRFATVLAFEPVAEHRECFVKNVAGTELVDPDTNAAELGDWLEVLYRRENPNVRALLFPFALGDREGSISIHTTPGSSGDSWIKGDGDIPLRTLDSFELGGVDLIKIDTEGHERAVLMGGEQTIRRCKPLLIVEQKPGHASKHFGLGDTDALLLLESWGAVRLAELSGDYIYGWPDA